MRVLVFGPGVIGTLFAARLARAGNDVAVFARGARVQQIREDGLRIRAPKGEVVEERVDVIEGFGVERFDWVLATIRGDQVEAALPTLSQQGTSDNVMILANQVGDLSALSDSLGSRLCLGFPGAGGTFDSEGVLHYQLSPRLIQPTTLGDLEGSSRVPELVRCLEAAGIPSTVEPQMEAWLTSHAAWISVFALLSPASNYNVERLRKDRGLRLLAARAIREALSAAEANGYRTTPGFVRWAFRAPPSLLAMLLARATTNAAMRRVFEDAGPGRRSEGKYLARSILTLGASRDHPMRNYRELVERAEQG